MTQESSDRKARDRPHPRVVLVVGDFPPVINGIGDYSAQLARALAKRGHSVTVLTTATGTNGPEWCASGVEVKRAIPAWTLRHLGTVIRSLGPLEPGTIIHVQYPSPSYRRNLMINLLPAVLRTLRPDVSVVFTIHEFRLQSIQWRARMLPMLVAAHGLVFVDPGDEPGVSRWTAFTRPVRASVPIGSNIPPVSVDAELRARWRAWLGIPYGAPLAVYFGELYEHKGFFELLDAVRRVRASGLPMLLLVVSASRLGTGAYAVRARESLQQAVQQGWATVQWDLEPHMVSRSLHVADVAVFPFTKGATRQRGSLIAAIDHGLPTITTRGEMTPQGFAEQFGVSLVPARNLDALVRRLSEVLTSPGERKRMADAAVVARERLSWDAIAGATSQFYAAVSAGGAARRSPLPAGPPVTGRARS